MAYACGRLPVECFRPEWKEQSHPPTHPSTRQVGKAAYNLYERFRPEWKGWGAKGELKLGTIRGLARSWGQEA